ncbi:MAG: DUF4399 domain-containing protein [Acidobacteria bacterium]|nr:DUF4399 domain-containing protein [Acidobacteriota bacterium]
MAGLVLVPALAVFGCGGGGGGMEAEPEMADEPMEEEAPASTGPPRVFFVAPLDGDQISSDHDVEVEFGVENYMISAIPEGFDPEADEPRADMGHYHLGVDTGCLPAGEIIPEGQGWVHFGDGSNVFTLQVEPAAYELTVQIGDDLHRTQEGLCETISIEVADGI